MKQPQRFNFALSQTVAIAILVSGSSASTQERPTMQRSDSPAPQIPPEVARYLRGAPPEGRQFEFLIGTWDVSATRYKDDGSVLLQYKASWNAQTLNEGRMIMDDFKALAPTGEPISSFVTLRTYSDATQRWELQGLAALQPAAALEWHGSWRDGQMVLDAAGQGPDGKPLKTRIRFFQIEKDRFSWESQVSRDGGRSWFRSASLNAVRTPH
jgi:hypothetical protein